MDFGSITFEAVHAGKRAMYDAKPRPMIVEQHENMADDASPVERAWYVEGGPCGFAWVNIRPGNSPYARYLKKIGLARKHYGETGVVWWISEGGQSVQLKEAYAEAVAGVLNAHGINASAGSRLD